MTAARPWWPATGRSPAQANERHLPSRERGLRYADYGLPRAERLMQPVTVVELPASQMNTTASNTAAYQ